MYRFFNQKQQFFSDFNSLKVFVLTINEISRNCVENSICKEMITP